VKTEQLFEKARKHLKAGHLESKLPEQAPRKRESVSRQEESRCHHEITGGCWLCKKHGFKPLRPPTPTVAEVLENPPYWLRAYLRGFWRGSVSLYVLAGAVAAAMGLSPHQWAKELMVEVEVYVPVSCQEQPARAVAA
jgi:hypothetical protein